MFLNSESRFVGGSQPECNLRLPHRRAKPGNHLNGAEEIHSSPRQPRISDFFVARTGRENSTFFVSCWRVKRFRTAETGGRSFYFITSGERKGFGRAKQQVAGRRRPQSGGELARSACHPIEVTSWNLNEFGILAQPNPGTAIEFGGKN